MKNVVVNGNVVKGDFFGGEIEPGTFHVHNIAPASDGRNEVPISEETAREDADTLGDDHLLPPGVF